MVIDLEAGCRISSLKPYGMEVLLAGHQQPDQQGVLSHGTVGGPDPTRQVPV